MLSPLDLERIFGTYATYIHSTYFVRTHSVFTVIFVLWFYYDHILRVLFWFDSLFFRLSCLFYLPFILSPSSLHILISLDFLPLFSSLFPFPLPFSFPPLTPFPPSQIHISHPFPLPPTLPLLPSPSPVTSPYPTRILTLPPYPLPSPSCPTLTLTLTPFTTRTPGLHKGNIFHGALSLHQLGYARPMAGYSNHRSPVKGNSLYLLILSVLFVVFLLV